VAEVARALVASDWRVKWWWHVDTLKREWDLDALIDDYGLAESVSVTLAPMDEQELVRRYRECDVTLAPGAGEGFCYPIWESLACGVPCVHGNYGGGASLMVTCGLEELLVEPVAWRLDGTHNALRPVYDPNDWARRTIEAANMLDRWRESTLHLDWSALGPRWQKWFRDGIVGVPA
jgi:glycosyltransferase involved in cell wall biosynthesis